MYAVAMVSYWWALFRVFVVRILNLYALMAGWKISTEVTYSVCVDACIDIIFNNKMLVIRNTEIHSLTA